MKRIPLTLRRGTLLAALALAVSLVIPSAHLFGGASEAKAAAPTQNGITIDEYLGCSSLIEDFIGAHLTDGYIIGTPYRGLVTSWSDAYAISRFNGDADGHGACNCTGVVAAAMRNCGGDLSRISTSRAGSYANGTNWYHTILDNNILCYRFSSMEEAMASGVARPGDMFYQHPLNWNLPGVDCHLGIWWGSNAHENMFLHCVPPALKHSPVTFNAAIYDIYIIPTRHRDLTAYADPYSVQEVFVPSIYAERNPDVAVAVGSNADDLYWHWTHYGVYEGRRASAAFDPAWYDASGQSDADTPYAQLMDFLLFGLPSGQQGSADFDPAYYRTANPDLDAAFGDNWISYYRHFLWCGIAEGRPGTGNGADAGAAEGEIDVVVYRALNPDLDAAFGDDEAALRLHWRTCGRNEGRIASLALEDGSSLFDVGFYLDTNPDLRAAFGDDEIAAKAHYLTFGIREGRSPSAGFDPIAYRKKNPDLDAAFSDELSSYVFHYLTFGQEEDRETQ